jgi:hypothetical protein
MAPNETNNIRELVTTANLCFVRVPTLALLHTSLVPPTMEHLTLPIPRPTPRKVASSHPVWASMSALPCTCPNPMPEWATPRPQAEDRTCQVRPTPQRNRLTPHRNPPTLHHNRATLLRNQLTPHRNQLTPHLSRFTLRLDRPTPRRNDLPPSVTPLHRRPPTVNRLRLILVSNRLMVNPTLILTDPVVDTPEESRYCTSLLWDKLNESLIAELPDCGTGARVQPTSRCGSLEEGHERLRNRREDHHQRPHQTFERPTFGDRRSIQDPLRQGPDQRAEERAERKLREHDRGVDDAATPVLRQRVARCHQRSGHRRRRPHRGDVHLDKRGNLHHQRSVPKE